MRIYTVQPLVCLLSMSGLPHWTATAACGAINTLYMLYIMFAGALQLWYDPFTYGCSANYVWSIITVTPS